MTQSTTVCIVDDHAITRRGVRAIFEDTAPDIKVIGETSTGPDTLTWLANLSLNRKALPDICLVDINLPGPIKGLEIVRQIRQQYPTIRAVVLSCFAEKDYGEQARKVGAIGYVSKDKACEELVPTIRQAMTSENSARDKDT